jgi:hypothetical protein
MENQPDVVAVLTEIRIAIEHLSSGSWGSAVFVAMVGGLSGAFAAYVFSRLLRRQNETALAAKNFVELINSFEAVAVCYWLYDSDPLKRQAAGLKEMKMKADAMLIVKYVRILRRAKIDTEVSAKLGKFESEIFTIFTGGDFESISRKASKHRARKISNACSKAKANLTEVSLSSLF